MKTFDLVPQMTKLYDLKQSLEEGLVKFQKEAEGYDTIIAAVENCDTLPDGYLESLKQNRQFIELNIQNIPKRIEYLDELINEHESGNTLICNTITLMFNAMGIYDEEIEPIEPVEKEDAEE